MYFVDCISLVICVGKSGRLETQVGIVGSVSCGLSFGRSCVETGMWSDVVALGDRGSHSVLVCGWWSCIVDVNILAYILSIRESERMLCRVGCG